MFFNINGEKRESFSGIRAAATMFFEKRSVSLQKRSAKSLKMALVLLTNVKVVSKNIFFLAFRLHVAEIAVPLHRVFHGIRFLKLKDWSSG